MVGTVSQRQQLRQPYITSTVAEHVTMCLYEYPELSLSMGSESNS